MTSSSSWKPPCWSQIPPSTQQWHLDELKNGILLATYSLNNLLLSSNNKRCCITFGRIDDPSQIDILTAHESCSRLHARIAFTVLGIPYLKDLASGNGTFVNNRQLPPEACGKWECTTDSSDNTKVKEVRGSRGVVLYPGDAIRFGFSTRIFVLEGPEEFERGAVRRMSDKRRTVVSGGDNQDEEVEAHHHDDVVETKEEEVCTWGMMSTDDDEQQDGDQLQQPSSASASASQSNNNNNKTNLPSIETFFSSTSSTAKYTISNTLQQLYNQYQSKSYKFDAITIESNRISQKEDKMMMGGVDQLTDGQRNQLAKNRDKLIALERSLRELKEKIEEGMCLAIYGKKALNNNYRLSHSKRDDGYGRDDVDDFFDRTTATTTTSLSKRQRDNNSHEEVESESSLMQKWKVLIQSYSQQQTVLSSKTNQCNKLQRQIDNSAAGDGDEEDVFFLQNDLNLVKEDVKKATSRLEGIEDDLKDVECLLKIVNPKLSWDRELGWIGTNLQIHAEKTKHNEMEADSAAATNVANEQDESIMMMPPPPKTAGISTSSSSFDMPPPPMMKATVAAKRPLSSFDMMPPPPKVTMGATESKSNAAEKKVITEHPINSDGATPQEKGGQSPPPPPPKKKRQLGPIRPPQTATAGTHGTLAALQQFTSSHSNEASLSKKKQKKSNNDNSTLLFDPRKDEWNAPSDQDGSGRTSLHDKFKGRY